MHNNLFVVLNICAVNSHTTRWCIYYRFKFEICIKMC